MSEIEYKGRDKFVPEDVTVKVTCKPKLLYPSSATNWANDMYAIRLNFREEHEVCYENENSACILKTNITESSIKFLIFLRDSLLQFELMTIEGDYSRILLGNIHLEREVLRLQTLSSRMKLCTYVLREWLWINSGICQWRGHGVATGALFGIPSDILIWPHFHSQATVPFVLAEVCWGCVNLLISDGAKTASIGGYS